MYTLKLYTDWLNKAKEKNYNLKFEKLEYKNGNFEII